MCMCVCVKGGGGGRKFFEIMYRSQSDQICPRDALYGSMQVATDDRTI